MPPGRARAYNPATMIRALALFLAFLPGPDRSLPHRLVTACLALPPALCRPIAEEAVQIAQDWRSGWLGPQAALDRLEALRRLAAAQGGAL